MYYIAVNGFQWNNQLRWFGVELVNGGVDPASKVGLMVWVELIDVELTCWLTRI